MDTAITYIELMNALVSSLITAGHSSVQVVKGRRFDRILTNDQVKYFVDKDTWTIYGAKSSFQYNPRREYGSLHTIEQFDWFTSFPKSGTPAEDNWLVREAEIQKNYKPRGRPRKVKP